MYIYIYISLTKIVYKTESDGLVNLRILFNAGPAGP